MPGKRSFMTRLSPMSAKLLGRLGSKSTLVHNVGNVALSVEAKESLVSTAERPLRTRPALWCNFLCNNSSEKHDSPADSEFRASFGAAKPVIPAS